MCKRGRKTAAALKKRDQQARTFTSRLWNLIIYITKVSLSASNVNFNSIQAIIVSPFKSVLAVNVNVNNDE